MGHLFESAGLTVPNSMLSNSQGQPTFVGSPQQVMSRANQAIDQTQPAFLLSNKDSQGPNANNLPTMGTPNLQQAAATGPAGIPNAMSPALTKGGKLATLLMSGLQGALAGRAASEQAVIQSGGRRSGGVGTGFQAGYQLPFLRAAMPLQLEKEQAETGLAQAGLQPVETPYGNMPAALASKILSPYLGYQGKVDAAKIGGQSRVQSADIGAQGRVQAAEVNKRFMAVPGVGLYDTQSRQLLPGSEQGVTITSEMAQDYGLPANFVGKPMTVANLAQLERNQINAAPTTTSTTDPLGLTTTSTKTKQLPANSGVPQASSGGARRAGAPAGGSNSNAAGGGNGSVIDSTARRLVEGDMDPSQLKKDDKGYPIILDRADKYSQQKYGKPFDIAQASSDYQYARNPQTQNTLKMINGMTEKGGAIEIAEKQASNLPQFDEATLNKVFNAASTEFGSTAASNFHTAMLGLADEYSKVMGGGISSDTGRDQALSLLRASYSKGQLAGAIAIMRQDISARKSALVGTNRYLVRQYGQQAAASSGNVDSLLKKHGF
ncbi:MAG: hypothetical protein JO356_01060 [Acidobacteria bacterium]|nr:hypothetical protein [Acidobacteriota bacterium]